MNKIRIKFCPKCSSTELIMVAGGNIGLWECKKCRFRSPIFPEKEIKQDTKKLKKK